MTTVKDFTNAVDDGNDSIHQDENGDVIDNEGAQCEPTNFVELINIKTQPDHYAFLKLLISPHQIEFKHLSE